MAPRGRRSCDWCGERLWRYSRTDARFCSTACRVAAWRHEERRRTDVLYRIEDDVDRAVRTILAGEW